MKSNHQTTHPYLRGLWRTACFSAIILAGLIGRAAVAENVPFARLTDAEKEQLKQRILGVHGIVTSAVGEAKAGNRDKCNEQLKMCVPLVEDIASHFQEPIEYFHFGINLGGAVKQASEGDDNLAASVIESFIPLVQVEPLAGMYQGMRLVLLQRYYQLGQWQKGVELVQSCKKDGIVSKMLVNEVAGFCSGMVIKGGLGKKGCELYASVLEDKSAIKDPSLNYGAALKNLAHLYANDHNYPMAIRTFNSIVTNAPGYYETNLATISYFRFAAFQGLKDETNMLIQLTTAAKAAKEHPEWLSDDVIQKDLPILVKQYQEAGQIDHKLAPVFSPNLYNSFGLVNPSRRKYVIGFLVFTSLAMGYLVMRSYKMTTRLT